MSNRALQTPKRPALPSLSLPSRPRSACTPTPPQVARAGINLVVDSRSISPTAPPASPHLLSPTHAVPSQARSPPASPSVAPMVPSLSPSHGRNVNRKAHEALQYRRALQSRQPPAQQSSSSPASFSPCPPASPGLHTSCPLPASPLGSPSVGAYMTRGPSAVPRTPARSLCQSHESLDLSSTEPMTAAHSSTPSVSLSLLSESFDSDSDPGSDTELDRDLDLLESKRDDHSPASTTKSDHDASCRPALTLHLPIGLANPQIDRQQSSWPAEPPSPSPGLHGLGMLSSRLPHELPLIHQKEDSPIQYHQLRPNSLSPLLTDSPISSPTQLRSRLGAAETTRRRKPAMSSTSTTEYSTSPTFDTLLSSSPKPTKPSRIPPSTSMWVVGCVAFFLLVFCVHAVYPRWSAGQQIPWRLHCASQPTVSLPATANVPPVHLFVAILSDSTTQAATRRHTIRQAWARNTSNAQVHFVLSPSKSSSHNDAIELERQVFQDVVILPLSTLNKGWWSSWRNRKESQRISSLLIWASTNVQADYLVKTDDTTFLLANQLERRLRLLHPLERTLWGYPLEGDRIQSDTWAASMDLIRSAASSKDLMGSLSGNEQGALDALVRTWSSSSSSTSHTALASAAALTAGSTATGLTLSRERCWMYDHPLSHTVHAHGYLFPHDVQQIKSEVRYGLPATQVQKRGGSQWYLSYSSVNDHTRFNRPLRTDRKAQAQSSLNPLGRVSALFEGGSEMASHRHQPEEGGTIAVRHVLSDVAWYETMLALQGASPG